MRPKEISNEQHKSLFGEVRNTTPEYNLLNPNDVQQRQ
jgi:hypothetical protein